MYKIFLYIFCTHICTSRCKAATLSILVRKDSYREQIAAVEARPCSAGLGLHGAPSSAQFDPLAACQNVER